MLQWFSATFTDSDEYLIQIPTSAESNLSMEEAALQAIDYITKNYPPPYHLMLSGGIDSQSLLYYWNKSGVDSFVPTHIRYVHEGKWYNSHDYPCYKHLYPHLTFLEIETDPMYFFENELLDYAYTYTCTSPQLCLHMKYRELVTGGTLIYSGTIASSFLTLNTTILGVHRYQERTKTNVIPNFFQSTRALYDECVRIETSGIHDKKWGYEGKCTELRNRLQLPLIPQLQKTTGFESIKDYYDLHNDVTLLERVKYASKFPSKRPFDLMFRYRLTEIIKYSDNIIVEYL